VPETCFPIGPSNGRGVSKDRHAAYLIKARRTNLHPKAGYIDADFLSQNFSLAVRRRTIHFGEFRIEVAENPTLREVRRMVPILHPVTEGSNSALCVIVGFAAATPTPLS
jgi:hypothetical protein